MPVCGFARRADFFGVLRSRVGCLGACVKSMKRKAWRVLTGGNGAAGALEG